MSWRLQIGSQSHKAGTWKKMSVELIATCEKDCYWAPFGERKGWQTSMQLLLCVTTQIILFYYMATCLDTLLSAKELFRFLGSHFLLFLMSFFCLWVSLSLPGSMWTSNQSTAVQFPPTMYTCALCKCLAGNTFAVLALAGPEGVELQQSYHSQVNWSSLL